MEAGDVGPVRLTAGDCKDNQTRSSIYGAGSAYPFWKEVAAYFMSRPFSIKLPAGRWRLAIERGIEYLPRYVRPRRRALTRIVSLRDIRFEALPFSADSTMNIGSRKSRREPRIEFVRSTRGATALDPPKIPGDGPFRDDEAELHKLAVDLGCTPISVVRRQQPDQSTNLVGDLWTAAARTESPAPVESKPARCQPTTVSGLTITFRHCGYPA